MRENKEKQALGDLMIKPVQRIPRYELLVKVTLTFLFYFCLFVPLWFFIIDKMSFNVFGLVWNTSGRAE